jgi:hypothetical protein
VPTDASKITNALYGPRVASIRIQARRPIQQLVQSAASVDGAAKTFGGRIYQPKS